MSHSRRKDEEATRDHQRTTIDPQRREPRRLQDGTADGRPDQSSNRHQREIHAQSRADEPAIRREMDNDGWRKTDETAGKETKHKGEDDHAADVVHGDQAEYQDAGEQRAGQHDVDGAQTVGDDVWKDSPKDRGSIENGEQVECKIFAGDVFGDGVVLHIEERNEEPLKCEEATQAKEHKWRGTEGSHVDHLTSSWW